MKFSIGDFISKRGQILSFLRENEKYEFYIY